MSQVLEDLKERILPYSSLKLDSGKYLVTSYFGKWCFLTEEEFMKLKGFSLDDELKEKLKKSWVIINKENVQDIVSGYVKLNRNLFMRPSLHMINTTNMCNYRCRYCHAGVSQGDSMMSEMTALKALKFMFENSGNALMIEFQGGEALLNWKVVKLVVERSRDLNISAKKRLDLSIVSNLSLMTEERLKFLTDNDVSICTSLDGPKEVHDENRRHLKDAGTYDETVNKIKFIQDYYKKNNLERCIGVLATISKPALSKHKEIIQTYMDLGVQVIHLRPLNNLGDALTVWKNLSYSADEFIEFWKKSMDYILELNRNGTFFIERGAFILLKRILQGEDPLYANMMSPAGDGRVALLYNFDGSIYSSDEGRMLKEDMFKIGTVDDKPEAVFGNDELISTWTSSFLDNTCYSCAFRPFCGSFPVITYQETGNLIPNITETFWHKLYFAMFKYLFEKIEENGKDKETFIKWINNNPME